MSMRRLPIYLVIDTSGSMLGAPINAVTQALQVFQAALNSDPRAIETVFVSVITFDSVARQVTPLTDVPSFKPPTLQASGSTCLGDALKMLEECIRRECVKNSTETQKGDWKPLVFIFTDGQPTDSWMDAADYLKQQKVGNIIACAAGDSADEQMLKNLSPTVVKVNDTTEQSIKAFFNWVTQSVLLTSQSVGTNPQAAQQGITLPPPPPGIVIVP